jgi:hypothetical protein
MNMNMCYFIQPLLISKMRLDYTIFLPCKFFIFRLPKMIFRKKNATVAATPPPETNEGDQNRKVI